MPQPWNAILTLQGVESDDHRILELVTWRELPLTLRVQTEDFGQHDGASPVGRIDTIGPAEEVRGGLAIRSTGVFSDSEPGLLAAQWVEEQVLRGVSVDPGALEYVEEVMDPATDEPVDMSEVWDAYDELEAAQLLDDDDTVDRITAWLQSLYYRVRFTLYEIAAATLVATPAFAEATIELATGEQAAASARPSARERLAGLWAPPRDRIGSLLTLEDRGGTMTRVAPYSVGRMVASAGAQQFRPDLAVYPTRNARRPQGLPADLVPLGGPGQTVAEALQGRSAPATFRADWFQPLPLTRPTKWTITDAGRQQGHLFTWGSCHRSFTGRCESPPRQSDFREFHAGEACLDDGSRLRTGVVTFADLHAADVAGLTVEQVARLMEDTGVQLGPVRLHADEFGVQACGQVYDDLSATDIARALAGYPSGDWRRVRGVMRLFGLHVVNTPGFPHYEEHDGTVERLVASMAPVPADGALGHGEAAGATCGCGGHEGACSCSLGRLSPAARATLIALDVEAGRRGMLDRRRTPALR